MLFRVMRLLHNYEKSDTMIVSYVGYLQENKRSCEFLDTINKRNNSNSADETIDIRIKANHP